MIKHSALRYFSRLNETLANIEVGHAVPIPFDQGVNTLIDLIKDTSAQERKVMIVGNGGSAAIASHVAIDLCKACGIDATALNDPSTLTCLANDFGYEEVFAKQIMLRGRPNDLLIAISSSGRSDNILLAVEAARAVRAQVVTFSGFDAHNPLRESLAMLKFYVPSSSYGMVELSHQILLHMVTDALCEEKSKEG